MVKAIPAYNKLKPFHPKSKNWMGYLLTMDDVTYYVAGDTDITTENRAVKCDVALVPVGGKFTMDYKDVAKLRRFISERAKILPRRVTGTCAHHQRELTTAIKRARHLALLPFSSD